VVERRSLSLGRRRAEVSGDRGGSFPMAIIL